MGKNRLNSWRTFRFYFIIFLRFLLFVVFLPWLYLFFLFVFFLCDFLILHAFYDKNVWDFSGLFLMPKFWNQIISISRSMTGQINTKRSTAHVLFEAVCLRNFHFSLSPVTFASKAAKVFDTFGQTTWKLKQRSRPRRITAKPWNNINTGGQNIPTNFSEFDLLSIKRSTTKFTFNLKLSNRR